jgi:hypothetical protein
MTSPDPHDVIRLVRGTRLQCRTAILLLSEQYLGREDTLAARFNLDPVNYAEWRLQKVAPGQCYLGLSKELIVQDLDEICLVKTHTDALLLFNLDIALAYLPYLDRAYVWGFLRDRFRKRRKALVITMPAQANDLLPDESSRLIWQSGGRLAEVI